jgi:hypothetical protein
MSLRRNPNIFYGMGKRRSTRRRGGNFSDFINKAGKFIKDNRLISTAVGLIPHPLGKVGAVGLRLAGLGKHRRRPVRRRRVGGNLRSLLTGPRLRAGLSSAHKFVKDQRLISSALKQFMPNSKLHLAAHTLGYGMRRRKPVRRRRVGGNLRSLLTGPRLKSGLSSAHRFIKDKRLISSALKHFMPDSNLHLAAQALGYGKGGMHSQRMIRGPRRMGGANFFSTEQIAVPKF